MNECSLGALFHGAPLYWGGKLRNRGHLALE